MLWKSESMIGPDPIVSANLYADGQLDSALVQVVGRFRRHLYKSGEESFVWAMRYGRRGEHLKIRVHGPAFRESELFRQLSKFAAVWLSKLPAQDLVQPRRLMLFSPPVDQDDIGHEEVADRQFLRTGYRRHPVSLGAEKLLANDEYVAGIVNCLGAGTDFILESLGLDNEGRLNQRQVQLLLLKAVVLATSALESLDLRLGYLVYHRDWMFRSRLKLAGLEREEKCKTLLERVCSSANSLKADHLAKLEDFALNMWDGGMAQNYPLAEMLKILCFQMKGMQSFDPFAADYRFGLIFKVLHNLGNVLGLNRISEALVYHVLYRIFDSNPPNVSLIPREN